MLLPRYELELFFKLHKALMFFVNDRLKVIPYRVASAEKFGRLAPEVRVKVRDALSANLQLIDSFVAENPAQLSNDELDIIRSWRHLVTGRFYVFREHKKFTVFVSTSSPATAYGVRALFQPFEELIGTDLPVLVETVLLPFNDVIIYDGVMEGYDLAFGPGLRRNLEQAYKDARARQGIVTSLPMREMPLKPKSPKPESILRPQSREETDEALGAVVVLTDQFCNEHLTEEYAVLCRKMAQKLSRKRPSPLLYVDPNLWASGIVQAIGIVNFLHDKRQTPYMRSIDIDHYFGTDPSTVAAIVATIRGMFKMNHLDPNWVLPSRLDRNPMVWMLKVNGLMMDIRHAPREAQEVAFRQGLIPYIPADRP